jgi:hypothetical protein
MPLKQGVCDDFDMEVERIDESHIEDALRE